jgi:hypothetical protein
MVYVLLKEAKDDCTGAFWGGNLNERIKRDSQSGKAPDCSQRQDKFVFAKTTFFRLKQISSKSEKTPICSQRQDKFVFAKAMFFRLKQSLFEI